MPSHPTDCICPYCHDWYQPEGADLSEVPREEICESCGKRFIRYDEFTVTIVTRPIVVEHQDERIREGK